jgi:hypothetical protein
MQLLKKNANDPDSLLRNAIKAVITGLLFGILPAIIKTLIGKEIY